MIDGILAGAVGMGKIAGVATVLSVGSPGALFRMRVLAGFGMGGLAVIVLNRHQLDEALASVFRHAFGPGQRPGAPLPRDFEAPWHFAGEPEGGWTVPSCPPPPREALAGEGGARALDFGVTE